MGPENSENNSSAREDSGWRLIFHSMVCEPCSSGVPESMCDYGRNLLSGVEQ
jgi:hypothetical protein